MDQIFDAPVVPVSAEAPINANYPTVDLDQAANVLNNIIDSGSVAAATTYESDEPTTYVLVGDSDSDTEFITLSSSGEVLSDYPNPSTKIESVDRESGTATDELMVSYPIKTRSELNL